MEIGWSQKGAFYTSKEKLSFPPNLAYAVFSKPFILNTDVSSEGLGAVFYQVRDVQEKGIAYASMELGKIGSEF